MNYFGKMVLGGSGIGQITLHPILIRKVSYTNIYDAESGALVSLGMEK